MDNLHDIGELGQKLIEEVRKQLEDNVDRIVPDQTLAHSFKKVAKMDPKRAFFLGASLMYFIRDDEVSNEILDQAILAADLVEPESTQIH